MANTVIQVSPAICTEIKKYYKHYLIDKLPPGSIFVAKLPSCTITAYRSGKVMFQGANHEAEAAKWGNSLAKRQAPKTKTSGNPLPSDISSMSVIGSDEVGTGDYFGPMTVVSAYVKREQIPLLKEIGVKDSKGLKDDQIAVIAKQLVEFIPFSLLKLPNEKYNRLQQSGMSQGKIKALLHNRAIDHLLKKIAPEKPEAILIDQFAEANTYYRYLKNEKVIIRDHVYFSTKGESVHLAVAAASIIARYAFVRAFTQLSNEAGFTLPKGAGHQVDIAAAKLIAQKGIEALPHFTKLHFANTEKAKKIARK